MTRFERSRQGRETAEFLASPVVSELTGVLHERLGARLYWHDGGHVGHLFSRRVQRDTEDFLQSSLCVTQTP